MGDSSGWVVDSSFVGDGCKCESDSSGCVGNSSGCVEDICGDVWVIAMVV